MKQLIDYLITAISICLLNFLLGAAIFIIYSDLQFSYGHCVLLANMYVGFAILSVIALVILIKAIK